MKLYPKDASHPGLLALVRQGRTRTRYVGEVDHPTRAANLAQAWRKALARDRLVTEEPTPGFMGVFASGAPIMTGNRSRDTKPEMLLRSALHRQGLRYPGVCSSGGATATHRGRGVREARVAVFVDGCYWHGCPRPSPASTRNSVFWRRRSTAIAPVRRDQHGAGGGGMDRGSGVGTRGVEEAASADRWHSQIQDLTRITCRHPTDVICAFQLAT